MVVAAYAIQKPCFVLQTKPESGNNDSLWKGQDCSLSSRFNMAVYSI